MDLQQLYNYQAWCYNTYCASVNMFYTSLEDYKNALEQSRERNMGELLPMAETISVRPAGFENSSTQIPGTETATMEIKVYNQGEMKTEICNRWRNGITCPYGEKCMFAHGENELLPVIRHSRYKTEVCHDFLAGKTCSYGQRCHFRHSLSEVNQGAMKTEICDMWQNGRTCPYGDRCLFAHGENERLPVKRHPRYRTQVCQTFLAQKSCPYGHRCHFRHDQETQH